MAYWYRHVNGEVIRKPDLVVNAAGGPTAYFTGPFVKEWWHEPDPPAPPHGREG